MLLEERRRDRCKIEEAIVEGKRDGIALVVARNEYVERQDSHGPAHEPAHVSPKNVLRN